MKRGGDGEVVKARKRSAAIVGDLNIYTSRGILMGAAATRGEIGAYFGSVERSKGWLICLYLGVTSREVREKANSGSAEGLQDAPFVC